MKIMLNGATAGSNFGDFIFAIMFQSAIGNKVGCENVYWYNTKITYSDFYKTHLNNSNKCKFNDINALVYMSGGYFCGDDKKIRDYVIRYLNYFSIGLKCIKKKKPYAIIGVEIGHSKNKWVEKIQKKILTNANIVTVRNINSYNVAREYGVKNLICTADSVFAMNDDLYINKNIHERIEKCKKKLVFFHINPETSKNKIIEEKVIPIINAFLKKHPEYAVVVSSDQDNPYQSGAVKYISDLIECETVIENTYSDPIALCKVLKKCDTVVTTKLHVGIVGMKLSKSVISFSGHTEKIARLYASLGEEKRSISLNNLTFEDGLNCLEEYYDKPICLPGEIVNLAERNFEILDEFLADVEERYC